MRNIVSTDKAIGSAILFLGIFLITLGARSPTITLFSCVLVISSALYLLFGKRITETEHFPRFQLTDRVRLANQIFFLINIALIVLSLWSHLYGKSPFYFLFLAAATSSIVLEILSLSETKVIHIHSILSKIIVLSLVQYAGICYSFPGIYGDDPWRHQGWTQETVNLGRISKGQITGNDYYGFPIFHLLNAITQALTSLPTNSSAFISVAIPEAVLSIIFVYLIGKRLVGTKGGLLAAVIVPFTDRFIENLTITAPGSLSFIFFVTILYLVFCRDSKGSKNAILAVLLSISLVLTHTLTSFVMLVSLMAISGSSKIRRMSDKQVVEYRTVSIVMVTFFSMTMLTRWMQEPLPGAGTVLDWAVMVFIDSLQKEFSLYTLPSTDVSYGVAVQNFGGMLLLLALAVIGALIYLRPRNRSERRIALVLTAGILMAIAYGTTLFLFTSILPYRWYLFGYVPVSILAVEGLLGILSIVRGDTKRLTVAMLLLLVMTLMMTTNSVSNADSPIFFNDASRRGLTQSELAAAQTLLDMGSGTIKTDLFYGNVIPYVIDYDGYKDMTVRGNEVFVLRNYYIHHPEWNKMYRTGIHKGGISNYVVERTPIPDLMKQYKIDEKPLIFNNGNVQVYLITLS